MQLTAKLVQSLPVQTGNGKNGQWKKQDVIVETDGTYPKKICVSIWGDKINESQLKPGNMLKIDFDVESREYNGRWYTEARAWKLDKDGSGSSFSAPAPTEEPYAVDNNASDDLPF